MVVSDMLPCGKQDFKYFIGYKDSNKIIIHLYAYSIQKWLYKRFWQKLMYAFFDKRWTFFR